MSEASLDRRSGEAPDSLDDEAVVRVVLDGDLQAFAILVDRRKAHVAAMIGRRVPVDRVDELCQETFVRASRALASFRNEKPFAAWLGGIATRVCCDFWRKEYASRETAFSVLAPLSCDAETWLDRVAAPAAHEAFARETDAREARELVDRALDGLSAVDRMVVTLVHLEEWTVAEAADMLGMSVVNVKVRAFRARGKMRKALSQIMEGRP